MSNGKKVFWTSLLYVISLGVLAIYALVVWYNLDSKLGFVTAFSTVILDFILYLYFKSGISKSPTVLSLTAVLNRLFLFIFGGNYWIYGYMILYIYYGVVLTFIIGNKRFPFED